MEPARLKIIYIKVIFRSNSASYGQNQKPKTALRYHHYFGTATCELCQGGRGLVLFLDQQLKKQLKFVSKTKRKNLMMKRGLEIIKYMNMLNR